MLTTCWLLFFGGRHFDTVKWISKTRKCCPCGEINLKRYNTSVSIYFDTWKYVLQSLRLFNLVGYNINDIKIPQRENTTMSLFRYSFLDILRKRNSKNFVHFRSADAIKANYRSISMVTHHDRLLHVCSSLKFYLKEFKFHNCYIWMYVSDCQECIFGRNI